MKNTCKLQLNTLHVRTKCKLHITANVIIKLRNSLSCILIIHILYYAIKAAHAYRYRSGRPAMVHATRCRCIQQDSGRLHQPVNQYVCSADAVETGENLSSAKDIKPDTAEWLPPDIRHFRPVPHHREDHCVWLPIRSLIVLQRLCVSRTNTPSSRVARPLLHWSRSWAVWHRCWRTTRTSLSSP